MLTRNTRIARTQKRSDRICNCVFSFFFATKRTIYCKIIVLYACCAVHVRGELACIYVCCASSGQVELPLHICLSCAVSPARSMHVHVLRGRVVYSFICASPADLAGFLRGLVYFPLASGIAFFLRERLISQFWQISASVLLK